MRLESRTPGWTEQVRGRNISGVRTANPRRIWNKTLRARLAASMQCRDVLKSAVMVTPRSFAQSTMGIVVPSASDKGDEGGPTTEMRAHFPALSGGSKLSDHLDAAFELSKL